MFLANSCSRLFTVAFRITLPACVSEKNLVVLLQGMMPVLTVWGMLCGYLKQVLVLALLLWGIRLECDSGMLTYSVSYDQASSTSYSNIFRLVLPIIFLIW